MFSSFHFSLELGCSGLKLVFADQSQNKIFCLVIDLVLNSNYFYIILIASSALTLPQSLYLLTEFSFGIFTIIPLVINLPTKSPMEMLRQ
jgi:hypothetical protein